jgi:hypothetical protein
MPTLLEEPLTRKQEDHVLQRVHRMERGSGIRIFIYNAKEKRKEFSLRLPFGLVKLLLSMVPMHYLKNMPQNISKKDIYRILDIAKHDGLLVDVQDEDEIVYVRLGRIAPWRYKEETKMSTQQMEILQMLQEGKITTEEADKLLGELNLVTDEHSRDMARSPNGAKMIRIRVFEGRMDKPKVRVSVPLSLAKFALRFVPKDSQAKINDMDIDIDEIVKQIEEGAEGRLVDIEDEDEETGKMTKVEILVE